MNKLSLIFLALLGFAAGCFLGMGNHAGLIGALLPGLLAALVVAGYFIRNRKWSVAAILGCCALAGSFSALAIPDANPVRRFCHEQHNLYIQVGSYYQLGTDPQGADSRGK